MTDAWVIALQAVAAAGLGAIIGLEREISAQPAGLRTHMLVALGAALFTLTGAQVLGGDPTRIAAQVVTGIGFLGGGAIVREGFTTKGLTTAASLWVTAAVGLAIGLRGWFAATLVTALALLVLYAVRRLEFVPRRHTVEATLTLAPEATLDRVEEAVRRVLPHSKVLRLSYSPGGQALVLSGRANAGESLAALGERLRGTEGVAGVDLSA